MTGGEHAVTLMGRRSRCEQGDLLYLAGLALWALRNAAGESATLSAVSRE